MIHYKMLHINGWIYVLCNLLSTVIKNVLVEYPRTCNCLPRPANTTDKTLMNKIVSNMHSLTTSIPGNFDMAYEFSVSGC